MVVPTESSIDITASFFVEFIFTSILLLVIFLNLDPSSAYRKKLTVDSSGLFTHRHRCWAYVSFDYNSWDDRKYGNCER